MIKNLFSLLNESINSNGFLLMILTTSILNNNIFIFIIIQFLLLLIHALIKTDGYSRNHSIIKNKEKEIFIVDGIHYLSIMLAVFPIKNYIIFGIFLSIMIVIINIFRYYKTKNIISTYKKEYEKENFIRIKEFKFDNEKINSFRYYLFFTIALFFFTIENSPELINLISYVLFLYFLIFVISSKFNFNPLTNKNMSILFIIELINISLKYDSITTKNEFIISSIIIILVFSLFDIISMCVFITNKSLFIKLYASDKEKNSPIINIFDNIDKSKFKIYVRIGDKNINLIIYKDFYLLEKNEYSNDKIVDTYSTCFYERPSKVRELIDLSKRKIDNFSSIENIILKNYSLYEIDSYLKENSIKYKDLTEDDLSIISMTRI